MTQSKILNCVYEHRYAQQMTQQELADAVGVTRQTIISIEKGNYEPSVRLALRIASVLGVKVETLFYESN